MSGRPTLAVIVVAATAAVLLLAGCSCHHEEIVTDCRVAGQLTDHQADVKYVSTGLPADVTCFSDSFSFVGSQTAASRDLTFAVRFHVRDSNAASPTDQTFPFVQFKMTVHDVPLGPSEIELDDTRAQVEGCTGLQGHLTIASLSQSCHDSIFCPIDLGATLTFAAVTTADRSMLSLTAATVDVHQAYVKRDVTRGGDGLGA